MSTPLLHDPQSLPMMEQDRQSYVDRHLMISSKTLDMAAESPVHIAAIAILIPRGVLRLTPVATTSFRPVEGRLSAGYEERIPAIPAVMFWEVSLWPLRAKDE